jgi:POT family proton-dependent oligopeptide transporter
MGINLGAFIGPFICGTLGEKLNWHYGFGAAGVGMVLGLIQYRFLRGKLGEAGLRPGHAGQASQGQKLAAIGAAAILVLIVVLGLVRVIHFKPIAMAEATTAILVGIAIVFFAGVIFFGGLDNVEKKRICVIVILCATGALFWAGFEQAGSSFNLFAERYTERFKAMMIAGCPRGVLIPTTWFQAIGPIFVITLSPVMGAVWLALGRRNLNPSIPLKFGFGLVLLGLGFLVLAGAAIFVARGQKVLPMWLITTYLLHTFGELCVSPVGLSSVTKLAPKRFVGQMMGAWFLATSLGNLIAGRLAGEFDPNAVGQMSGRFLQMVVFPVGVAIVIIALSRPIKKMMGGVT